MILWHEKFFLPGETILQLKEKYTDEYFLKGDPGWGQHYTGYHRNPNNSAATVNGGFVDRDLLSIYVPKLKSVLEKIGLLDNKSIYTFNSIWGQLYKRELGAIIDVHNHYSEPRHLISWVHFIEVPEQKCFYFKVGDHKIYPETQSTSDIIFYPSYAMHGVDKMTEGEDRFVVVGNITRLN